MMNNMMYSGVWGFGFGILWILHILSVIGFFTGVVFLIILATKILTHAQLKTWGLSLIIGGTIVCVFTIGMMGHSWQYSGMNAGTRGMMKSGMGMSMNGMTMMLQGKTGDDFDAAFLQMMIPHHQGAINMAELVEKNAKHTEIKAMAKDIISAQQKEIDQMQQWQTTWGYTQ